VAAERSQVQRGPDVPLVRGLWLVQSALPFFGASAQARKGVFFMTAWIIVLAGFCIGMSVWFWKRIIIEFSYDGSALRLRTLGRPDMQTRALSEIQDVDGWRGRGGPQGYKLKFRDGQKMYLHYSVTNAAAAAERIRSEIRR
jgi:hypothetical protein